MRLSGHELEELRGQLGEVAASVYAEPNPERGQGGYCNVCLTKCAPGEQLQHEDCPLPRVLAWERQLRGR